MSGYEIFVKLSVIVARYKTLRYSNISVKISGL
jgi:hypothetical protein